MSESPPGSRKILLALGGVSRTGKDTTVNMLTAAYPDIQTVSTDDVRAELWRDESLESQAVRDHANGVPSLAHNLFRQSFYFDARTNDEEWIARVLDAGIPDDRRRFFARHDAQGRAVWQLGNLPSRIRELLDGPGIGQCLVQGIAVLPEYLAQIRETNQDLEVRPLYLINRNPAHSDEIVEIVERARRTDPATDWMAAMSWSERRIRAFMEVTAELGELRRIEAEQYGFPWVDMGNGDFMANVVRNVDYLVGRA